MFKPVALGFAVLGLVAASPAQASYEIVVQQVGANVVATGSGSINLSALTFALSANTTPSVDPSSGLLVVGSGPYSLYSGASGPSSFGGGGLLFANSYTGGLVAVRGSDGSVAVPQGYVSGTSLGASTSTFNNATFASLGLNTGTYVWTWGRESAADSFTVRIGSAVPEPSTWVMMLLGFGAIGFAMRRNRSPGLARAA